MSHNSQSRKRGQEQRKVEHRQRKKDAQLKLLKEKRDRKAAKRLDAALERAEPPASSDSDYDQTGR